MPRTWKAEYIVSPLHKFVTVIWFRVNVPVLSVAKRVNCHSINLSMKNRNIKALTEPRVSTPVVNERATLIFRLFD